MRCYAFKGKDKEETLYQHVMGIIDCLSEARETRGFKRKMEPEAWEIKGFKRKMKRIYGMTEDEVNDMLLLAAIIHDLGKTEERLQGECDKGECERFAHHYAISAKLALRLGYEVPELGLSPNNIDGRLRELLGSEGLQKLDLGGAYLLMVVVPALLHHYAQITGESKILDGLRSTGMSLKIREGCVEEIGRVIDTARQYFRSEVGRMILEKLESLVKGGSVELGMINEKTFQDISMSYVYAPGRLVAEAATGLLNICDGRVASANRRSSQLYRSDSSYSPNRG